MKKKYYYLPKDIYMWMKSKSNNIMDYWIHMIGLLLISIFSVIVYGIMLLLITKVSQNSVILFGILLFISTVIQIVVLTVWSIKMYYINDLDMLQFRKKEIIILIIFIVTLAASLTIHSS